MQLEQINRKNKQKMVQKCYFFAFSNVWEKKPTKLDSLQFEKLQSLKFIIVYNQYFCLQTLAIPVVEFSREEFEFFLAKNQL